MQKLLIGLITRCKDEFFIKEFCDYYLSQGIDRIFVIDDNSKNKNIYNDIKSNKIKIIYEKNIIIKNYANELYKKIKDTFEWMIYVDVDEFIITKKNKKNTIRDELLTVYNNFDCICIPWVMMSCNGKKENPKSILLENTYRWNHNNQHENSNNNLHKFRCRYKYIEIKSIFKCEKFKSISDHVPIPYDYKNINCTYSVPSNKNCLDKKLNKIRSNFKNLRESHIKNGNLLCYHYRIISEQNCLDKIKNNFWYIENKYNLKNLLSNDYPEIKDETLKYKIINNKLKFTHITKTSGTYIENLAKSKNLFWGKNDEIIKLYKKKTKLKPYWHIPLNKFNNNIYDKNVKIFTIVRNPYERVISECLCKWGSKYSKSMNSIDDLNSYIKKQVSKTNNSDFLHFKPQYLYIYNNDGIKIVDYILKFENIDIEFNNLMKKYNIDLKYKKYENKNKKFNVKDISSENIKLINFVYNKDFKYFNYKKLKIIF